MAKDVNKTQKKNIKEKSNENSKKVTKKQDVKKQPKKEIVKEKKIVVKEKNEKKDNVKEVTKKDIVKEKKKNDNVKETKKSDKKITSVIKKVDDNRKAILFCIVGFLVATLLFRCILWPDRIATLADGTQPVANINGEAYTADQLYEDMKENYSISVLLNEVDGKILSELYPEDEDMLTQINETADYYYSIYESSYGYTKEEFLSNYGFSSESAFLESLKLDYRRNEYYEDYAEGLVTEDEINSYYDKEVFGDVDSKHILVQIADKDKDKEEGLSDADAKKLAEEIIKKLNDGKSWDDVVAEYKDKIVSEELGYMAFNASLESAYLKECRNLEVGTYSKTPVLTSYGYHIVYKIDQKDTPKLDEVKEDIIDILASEKKEKDENLYGKSLVSMREEAKLEFVDTVFADAYTKYINQYK